MAYLANHSIPQAEFRSTLITQISFHLEAEILRTYHAVLECCVEASKPPSCNVDAISDPTAVWLLAVVFERLVLAPNHDPDTSINQKVQEYMPLFRSGQIEKLFKSKERFSQNPLRSKLFTHLTSPARLRLPWTTTTSAQPVPVSHQTSR